MLGSAQEAEKEAEKEDHIEDDVDMGFGDVDEEEKEAGGGEEEAEDAADFAVLGEEHDDDDREAAKSEPVELEVAEKLDLDDMRAEQESAEQLPDALVEQFHTAVTRAGRARKKSRKQMEADKQVFYIPDAASVTRGEKKKKAKKS